MMQMTGQATARSPLGQGVNGACHRDIWAGRTILVSTAALVAEMAIGGVALILIGLSQDPESEFTGLGLVFTTVVILPMLAIVSVILGLLATLILVLPIVWLARRAKGRWGWTQKGAVWGVPLVAPIVSAALLLVGSVLYTMASGAVGSPTVHAWWWLALTAFSVPSALFAWLAASRTEPGSGLRLALRVFASGAAGAVGLALWGGLAYATGLVKLYEPPHLSRADVVGIWQDGRGGTLELAADGGATAHRLSDTGHGHCEGTGKWSLESSGTRSQDLELAGACGTTWSIGGTSERPTLYYYVGDPDEGHRYTLLRGSER
ncbi:hypothetical protein [Streptomyces noursei]|uniref:Uncharacterized protein n=1 Tax=Streptomyces noursei TaxID=1971 RepID=A0A2N8PI60_STRNR|nr:hypothetical protein [Streptomyces noursei]PNE40676.1 hypothetical protein AOB60_07500 [Streptomyces noursei]